MTSDSPNGLRKTFARRVYKVTGGELMKLKRIMGHGNIATTERYLEFMATDVWDELERGLT
jgi:hypothetical protein